MLSSWRRPLPFRHGGICRRSLKLTHEQTIITVLCRLTLAPTCDVECRQEILTCHQKPVTRNQPPGTSHQEPVRTRKSEHYSQMSDCRRPLESLWMRGHMFESQTALAWQWAGLTDWLVPSSDSPPATSVKQTGDNLVMRLPDGSEWPPASSKHHHPPQPPGTARNATKCSTPTSLLCEPRYLSCHLTARTWCCGRVPRCVMQQCVSPGLFNILFTHSPGCAATVYTPADSEQLSYQPANNSCALSAEKRMQRSYAAPYIYNICDIFRNILEGFSSRVRKR